MMNRCIKSYINLYQSRHFSKGINEAIYNLCKHNEKLLSLNKIGESVQGTPILSIAIGEGSTKILIQGTHHAREAITTILLLDQINYLLKLYKMDKSINNMSINKLLKYVTFVFVPLVNPDGADLVINGGKYVSSEYKYKPYLKEELFPRWKANINGVDLNRNYPTKYPADDSVAHPQYAFYKGPYYFSEPETCALKCLTEKYLFDGTISYHSSGEIIYYQYNQLNIERDFAIASKISKETGYVLEETKQPVTGSGYKDWFIENYEKPGLTLEVSTYVGEQKVPVENYRDIFERNKNVPILFAQEVFYRVI
ncbi:M14 family zinc carboxypeptidase [Terrisporobacter vanillatitrophus]|uniref:M14 family zinc carboxypeptidase n=1 Tax=Terrisporobacter vanillatitrophus TaxID=3058402 RepID=UPI003369AF19